MIKIDEKKVAKFWDDIAKKTTLSDKKGVGMLTEGNDYYNIIRTNEEFSKLDEILNKLRISTVLEIGCGTGRYTQYFAEKKIYYHGTDLSKNMINLANKLNQKYILNGYAKFNIVNGVPNINEKYDLIIIGGVLQYINDDELSDLLKNVSKISKKYILTRDTLRMKEKEIKLDEYHVIYRTPFSIDVQFKKINFKLLFRGDSYNSQLLSSKMNKLYKLRIIPLKLIYITHTLILLFYKPLRMIIIFIFSKKYKKYGSLRHQFSFYINE